MMVFHITLHYAYIGLSKSSVPHKLFRTSGCYMGHFE